jgi:hypothetical protein
MEVGREVEGFQQSKGDDGFEGENRRSDEWI